MVNSLVKAPEISEPFLGGAVADPLPGSLSTGMRPRARRPFGEGVQCDGGADADAAGLRVARERKRGLAGVQAEVGGDVGDGQRSQSAMKDHQLVIALEPRSYGMALSKPGRDCIQKTYQLCSVSPSGACPRAIGIAAYPRYRR